MEPDDDGDQGHRASTLLPEMMMDIFSRLAVKILCKFRCVSKSWVNLISDPHFRNLHCDRSLKNPRLLLSWDAYGHKLYGGDDSIVYLSTMDISDGTKQKMFMVNVLDPSWYTIAHCHGLICLVSYDQVHICNPSTQEVVRLPDYLGKGVALGYLPSVNEYKVVCLFPRQFNDEHADLFATGCNIFTIKDGGSVWGPWRDIGNCPSKVLQWGFPVSANGAIYWVISESCNERKIFFLDLEIEEFGMILCPQGCSHYIGDMVYLVELKGSCCLVEHLQGCSTMDIWMLKDNNSHIWAKEYCINLDSMSMYTLVLGYVSSDDHDGELLIRTNQEILLLYNVKSRSFRKVENLNLRAQNLPCLYFDSFFDLGSRKI